MPAVDADYRGTPEIINLEAGGQPSIIRIVPTLVQILEDPRDVSWGVVSGYRVVIRADTKMLEVMSHMQSLRASD